VCIVSHDLVTHGTSLILVSGVTCYCPPLSFWFVASEIYRSKCLEEARTIRKYAGQLRVILEEAMI
jgi:hypothetical protein